jgi:hypothetical protein
MLLESERTKNVKDEHKSIITKQQDHMHREYKWISGNFNHEEFQDEHSQAIANTIIRRSRYEVGFLDLLGRELRKILCCCRRYRRDNLVKDTKMQSAE